MSASLAVRPSTSGRTTIEFPVIRDLFDDMDAITSRIAERAFSLFHERGGLAGRDWDDWFHAESELLKAVPVEISETDDSYTIRAEVPGFDVNNLNVQVDPSSVYIHGKTEQKKEEKNGGQIKYSEVSANELARKVALPSSISPDKASAVLKNGILEITLPKSAPPKRLDVKAA